MKRYQLSLPGPTETAPEVLAALSEPMLPHYGAEWLDFYRSVLAGLKTAFRTEQGAYIIPSSGSGAIETVFASLGPQRGLIVTNGFFGTRMAAIASRHLADVTVLEVEPNDPLPYERVESSLATGDYDVLCVVHGETSTGALNPLETFAELARRYDTLFVVDAISTLGGVPLAVDELGIDFCISASQKAVGAVAGLGFTTVSDRGRARLQSDEDGIGSWYFNLRVWEWYEEHWGDWHPYPMTLPVALYYALGRALDMLLETGLEAAWEQHRSVSKLIESELQSMGIGQYIQDPRRRLPTVTAATVPPGTSAEELRAYLKDRLGILVAGGVGPLRDQVFRIGHMGYSARPEVVHRVLAGIREFLRR